jgi:hypothetical protein
MTGDRPPAAPDRPHQTLVNAAQHNQFPARESRRRLEPASRPHARRRGWTFSPALNGPLAGACLHAGREPANSGHDTRSEDLAGPHSFTDDSPRQVDQGWHRQHTTPTAGVADQAVRIARVAEKGLAPHARHRSNEHPGILSLPFGDAVCNFAAGGRVGRPRCRAGLGWWAGAGDCPLHLTAHTTSRRRLERGKITVPVDDAYLPAVHEPSRRRSRESCRSTSLSCIVGRCSTQPCRSQMAAECIDA